MTFKKYCINRNIEEAVQILEYLESQGVVEEGFVGRALDAAISGVGRGTIEGGKRVLNVAMGKGKDPAPMIGNAISNLKQAIKFSQSNPNLPDLSKKLDRVLEYLGKQQKHIAATSINKAAPAAGAPPKRRPAPTTTSTAAPDAVAKAMSRADTGV